MAILALLSAPPHMCRAEEDIVTVFVPSVSEIDKLPSEKESGAKNGSGRLMWKNENVPEADILMTLMRPRSRTPYGMDMPQSFAMIFQPDKGGEPVRKDLLGDAEEILYRDQKAWGANVELPEPGLYQFVAEGKPFWDERKGIYLQQSAKVFLPVLSGGSGWENPAGQSMEIIPLSRPYGLRCPALFSALALHDGRPAAGIPVSAALISSAGKNPAASRWSGFMESRTDSSGIFSFVFNQPGWWICDAAAAGDPLKGADGQMKEVRKSAIIWVYVE